MLAELEGDGAAAGADPAGRAGRLAFTGTGVDQRQQWQRVARMEEGSDMESDEVSWRQSRASRGRGGVREGRTWVSFAAPLVRARESASQFARWLHLLMRACGASAALLFQIVIRLLNPLKQ